jgi:hypothetical protein
MSDELHRGEGPCMDCGTLDTPVWSAPNDLWNRVVGSPDGFLCPWCFAVRADSVIGPRVWDFAPRGAVVNDDKGMLLTRIVIERRLGEDGEDQVVASFEDREGEMPSLVEVLGMLSMTTDTALRQAMGEIPDEDDE